MGINKGEIFAERDVFIDYDFEDVMFRWDHKAEKIYKKFYGKDENPEPVPHCNDLFNEALLGGVEISEDDYRKGKDRIPLKPFDYTGLRMGDISKEEQND